MGTPTAQGARQEEPEDERGARQAPRAAEEIQHCYTLARTRNHGRQHTSDRLRGCPASGEN
eukprot:3546201-Pyramimonas_sp.AAC.1